MPLSRRAVYLLLLVVLSAQWIVPAPAGAVSAGDSKTYIEFILDASVSMTARLEGRKTRMDVAREVMEELIRELPETPGLEIALRVYGAELVRGMAPCEDSVLVQGFKPVRDARGPMITAVRDMKPKGMTPIGLSLELAAKDFPRDPDARKIVVLVTDGEESCGADPCAISRRLQEQGLMLKPYVVGFALSEKQAALVRCIGEYFEASDTASLRKALTSIMVQAISPAVLEVQAFGGGENVTSRAGIHVFNALGQPAKPGRLSPDRSSLLFELDEGVYTVRGDLSVGSEVVTATQPNIMAKSGQTTRIRLDFGPLTGMIRVFARVGGQDASDRVDIEVTKAGAPVAAQWFGAPPVAMVPAGQYEVTVTLKGYPASARSASAWVSPNKESALVFDLPAPQATLAVRAIYVGQDITPSCEFRVLSAGQVKASSPAGRGQFVIQADPGVVGVVARYVGDVSVEKTVPGVRLVAGETTNVTVDFGDMLATLRARVVARGADVTAVSKVSLAGQRTVPDVPLRGAYRETITTPGAYGVMATYAGIESDIVEAYAKPGQVTDVVVEVKMPGQLVVTPRMEGKALSPDRVVCEVFEGTASMGRMIPQMGKLVMSLPEGVYTVRGSIDTPAPQMQEIPNVAIRSGVVTDLVMDFLTEARVRVIVTAAGKPFRDADVSLMQGTKFVSWMTEQSPGVWEIAREPGVYDVVIQPKAVGSDPIHLTGIELTRGKTIEKTVAVDPRGVIAVKLLAAGTPTSDADVGLVRDGKFLSWIERKQAGLFEITVAPGVYDVTVRPKVSGYKEQTVSPVE
ncbi:MAG: VWA domain-containing protein, partial [Firmicutes bacterium]|nr:VWA domain-containing protein [Bacillota bacterium]